jgi:Putative beta-barrel porin 2
VTRNAGLAALLLTCLATSAAGQQINIPDTTRARLRIGPVLVAPVIDLTNLGVDTNVFNQPADQAQEDFTFTLSPRADVWMKVGPTWISGNVREDLIWYETFASQRAANTSASVNWIVPLNRLRFSVGTAYLWALDRPSLEIDARVPRVETQINGAAEARALSRTFFGVQASRRHVEFQEDARFIDTALRVELNRVTTNVAVNARNELTPLTSISIDVGRINDRFDYSQLRDSDSTTAGVQVTFDPSALIKGSARVGYRDFEPLDHSVPSYQGTTVAVDLSYVLLGATKFGIQLGRDVQYSYDVNQPYYLQNGISGTIQQQIFGPVDAIAGLGFYSLAYRDRAGTVTLYPDRVDKNRSFNFGVGYHMTPDLRIGVRLEKQWRDTEVGPRQFEGFRIGLAVTYGT